MHAKENIVKMLIKSLNYFGSKINFYSINDK